MTEHFVPNESGTRAIRIHCLEFHEHGTEEPLLIVPGMINSAEEIVAAVGKYLTRRTIIMSLRGRGKSDSPTTGYTLDDQAGDIVAVADGLGLQSLHLFGHSTGGSIAARSLNKLGSRVRSITMGDYPPGYPCPDAKWGERILRLEGRDISDMAVEGLVREGSNERVMPDLIASSARKALIKGGTESSMLPEELLELMREKIPDLEVHILEDAGHDFLDEKPEESIQLIYRITQ